MSGYPVDRNELFNFDGRLCVFEHENTLHNTQKKEKQHKMEAERW